MTTAAEIQHLQEHGLYSGADEHDACGVGFVAHIKGEKSHAIVLQGLKILENLDHRGAVGADKLMGDGAGILIQLPDRCTAKKWPSRASRCRLMASTASA
jgi:glutamate synthase (NADPH/NADH) large chain